MMNIKKASPLAGLALAGALAGCSGEPREYRHLTDEDLLRESVPIEVYSLTEKGKTYEPLYSTSCFLQDFDRDGQVDGIYYMGSYWFMAENYEGPQREGITGQTTMIPQELRERLSDYMAEGKELGKLLTNLKADHFNKKQERGNE